MFKSQFTIGICLTFVILTLTFPSITAAEIKVYDNENQYLGILLDMNVGGMTIFIPSINASLTLNENEIHSPDSCNPYNSIFLLFESNDCSGTPYIPGSFPNARYNNCPPIAPGYYLPDRNSPGQFVPKSQLYGDLDGNPECTEVASWPPSYPFYEAKKIQLPFTTPISLPVRFENVAGTSDFYVIPVKKK